MHRDRWLNASFFVEHFTVHRPHWSAIVTAIVRNTRIRISNAHLTWKKSPNAFNSPSYFAGSIVAFLGVVSGYTASYSSARYSSVTRVWPGNDDLTNAFV